MFNEIITRNRSIWLWCYSIIHIGSSAGNVFLDFRYCWSDFLGKIPLSQLWHQHAKNFCRSDQSHALSWKRMSIQYSNFHFLLNSVAVFLKYFIVVFGIKSCWNLEHNACHTNTSIIYHQTFHAILLMSFLFSYI